MKDLMHKNSFILYTELCIIIQLLKWVFLRRDLKDFSGDEA